MKIFISSDWGKADKTATAVSHFLSEDLNANNFKIVNLKGPSLENDAVTQGWVKQNMCDRAQVENTIKELALMKNAEIDMKKQRIVNLAPPVDAGDAIMKQYLDHRLGAFLVKNSIIDMKGKRIVNIADAATGSDAVNRQYLDRALKQNLTETKRKAFFSGTTLCKQTETNMTLNITLASSDYVECGGLKIKQKGVYKIALWLRMLAESNAHVIVTLRKNDDDFPIAEHVYFMLDADVNERDHYFVVMHELEQNDALLFTAKGSDEFSIVSYLKITFQGVLPEMST